MKLSFGNQDFKFSSATAWQNPNVDESLGRSKTLEADEMIDKFTPQQLQDLIKGNKEKLNEKQDVNNRLVL